MAACSTSSPVPVKWIKIGLSYFGFVREVSPPVVPHDIREGFPRIRDGAGDSFLCGRALSPQASFRSLEFRALGVFRWSFGGNPLVLRWVPHPVLVVTVPAGAEEAVTEEASSDR